MQNNVFRILAHAALVALMVAFGAADAALAQRAQVVSPGTPAGTTLGQSTRFDSDFNPAVSLATDLVADWYDHSGTSEDGLDLGLRRVDLLVADWIDPNAFAWITAAYEEEEFGIEEGAIEYVGLPGNWSLRGGRFFVDFGKQMQAHIEQLRTIDRPLVLREYLGEELPGDGAQVDNWLGLGDRTLVRFSGGVFGDLGAEGHGHGDQIGPVISSPERAQAGDLGYTARLTGLTEIGENGTLQIGSSARFLSDFAFMVDGSAAMAAELDNAVYGLDLTYGWLSDAGTRSLTVGGEYLYFDGNIGAEFDDNGTPGDGTDDTLTVLDDSVSGAYAFIDYGWSQFSSAGVQYSYAEEPSSGKADLSELDVYYTRRLSDFLRLRVATTLGQVEGGEDYTRVAIQLSGFIGPHGHGLNW